MKRGLSGPAALAVLSLALGLNSASASTDTAGPATRPLDVPAVHLSSADDRAAARARAGGEDLEVVAVGDSVTEADSTSFDTGTFGPGSWAMSADGGEVDIRGGWALAGATTTNMVAGVREPGSRARDADVLVVMAGTNDVRFGVPWARSARNLERIVAAVGADRVVVCTIVPLDQDPAGETRYNDRLRALAEENGWDLVDSAAAVRDADGGWVPGTSDDGLHPNRVGAQLIGSVVRHALVEDPAEG